MKIFFILRQIRRCLFVGVAWTFLSLPAHARNYIVEAIVFKHQEINQQNQEVWDASSSRTRARIDRVRNLISRSRTITNTRNLKVLSEVSHKLSASSAYQVQKTISWVQAQANYGNSKRVNILAQDLKGVIHVYAPSLLFVEIHLQYTPQALFAALDGAPPSYFIGEKRKIKLNETHYFDHPHFGVIVNVRPQT